MQHLIWSTLEDTREQLPVDSDRYPTLAGYTVPHFDAKAEADALFEQLGVPTTYLRTSFNWENFARGFGPTAARTAASCSACRSASAGSPGSRSRTSDAPR